MIALHSDTASRPRIRTTVGVPVGTRPRLSPGACARVRRQLEHGPFLAAFDAGIVDVRDIAGDVTHAHLVLIRDDELIDAIDRDREFRRRVA